MFEDLPALDDYELIRTTFAEKYIKVKAIEINALFELRDEFAVYFKIPKRKSLVCLIDFFKDDFFLLMPIYETIRAIGGRGISNLRWHLNAFADSEYVENRDISSYKKFIHEFLCMVCNLK